MRYGCLHVPEGRQLFTELSVDDNIRLGAFATDRKTIDADSAAVYERFPALADTQNANRVLALAAANSRCSRSRAR